MIQIIMNTGNNTGRKNNPFKINEAHQRNMYVKKEKNTYVLPNSPEDILFMLLFK